MPSGKQRRRAATAGSMVLTVRPLTMMHDAEKPWSKGSSVAAQQPCTTSYVTLSLSLALQLAATMHLCWLELGRIEHGASYTETHKLHEPNGISQQSYHRKQC
mmetsp:Transcript_22010/g.60927  ORF Transcript_22010/g.60927 Transcript_22010/m.60927 type:complete len:103 (+) Transcript_22010:1258-1566(+)